MVTELSTRFFIVYVKPPIEYPCDTYDHDSALHFGATMDHMVVIFDLILSFGPLIFFYSAPFPYHFFSWHCVAIRYVDIIRAILRTNLKRD